MACAITAGISSIDCRDNAAGITEVFITELANKNAIAYTSEKITTFTLTVGKQFWAFQQIKESSEWNETPKINIQGGTIGWEQDVTIVIPKRTTTKRNIITELAQNTLMIICLDLNGLYWLLGEVRGCDLADASKYASGKVISDANAWTLQFKGAEGVQAREVDSALIAALIVPAV